MTADELRTIEEVAATYKQLIKVGCNGCSYCLPCPSGVNIPRCFAFYNKYFTTEKKLKTRVLYGLELMGGYGEPADASLCQNCGKCVKACPQQIAILLATWWIPDKGTARQCSTGHSRFSIF
jgi:predicted aldo/keto reductase-like oxidoreductase